MCIALERKRVPFLQVLHGYHAHLSITVSTLHTDSPIKQGYCSPYKDMSQRPILGVFSEFLWIVQVERMVCLEVI